MHFFDNHTNLFTTVFAFFLFLTIAVAVMPAVYNQNNNAVLPTAVAMSDDALEGKLLYIQEGCVGCHTQQVRGIEMDKTWGSRPSISADYAGNTRTDFWRNTATLMGTERTGPDLTSIGSRQPSLDWHLIHLFQPRAVVSASVMPAYPWFFEYKETLEREDIEVKVADQYKNGKGKYIVATPKALKLIAYLLSLQQAPLPVGAVQPAIRYKKAEKSLEVGAGVTSEVDGKVLYSSNCQGCHQASGEGILGAFPALKGSAVVNSEDPKVFIDIIMNGYDAREQFGVMPAVGNNAHLTPQEVAAIVNHERTNWGNHAKKVSVKEVETIIKMLKTKTIN